MITKIFSDLETFQTLNFKKGLNILLAERHESSGARDTRNGTGKTSMVELIHFLVQERKNKDDDFHNEALIGRTFGATFEGDAESFTLTRKSVPGSGRDHDVARFNGNPIDAKELRTDLAHRWFDLDEKETSEIYSPKFGALFSYIARKERNGGFNHPVQNASGQKPWDSQVNLSYLLGFDWRLIQKLQRLKDDKIKADNLVKMIKDGYFSDGPLDPNKMQSRLDILDGLVDQKREEVKSAKVVDGYRDHERTANELTQRIRDLNEANLEDLDLQDSIDLALEEVEEANIADIEALYNQVNVFFEGQVKKRFEDVSAFHKKLAHNRQRQLADEKRRAIQRVNDRHDEINQLQDALSGKLALLRSGMAIDRLTILQSELTALEAEMADLQLQLPRLRGAIDEQARFKREIGEQIELIGHDVQEREEARKFAVQAFADLSNQLYDVPGELILGRSPGVGGLQIDTNILGKKSGGKSRMQIFCLDWVLAQTARRLGRSPGFLIHDSHIFDGVDGRQIGLALSVAQKKCDELGIQYIVAMNSDDLDKVKSEEEATGEEIFDPTEYIMETRLSDDQTGGLFGIRF